MKIRNRVKRQFAVFAAAAAVLAMSAGCGLVSEVQATESSAASQTESAAGMAEDPEQVSAEGAETQQAPASDSGAEETAGTANADADMFTDRDRETGYDEDECTKILLTGSTAECADSGVSVDGSTVTITAEGEYLVSGTLDDGMIIVDVQDTEKVRLILDGAEITNADGAAVYVRQADKVFITTAAGTVNTLENGGSYTQIDDNAIDAVIYSRDDLTLNGAGELVVTAAEGHGIVSKDDLKITCGSYTITAASKGMSAHDSIRIADGSFTINAGTDALHAEDKDDETKGFVYIESGSFALTAGDDGIYSAQNMTVLGGTYVLNAGDDTLHSAADLTVSGGSLTITAGDDALHADGALLAAGGEITVESSYEGLEGLTVTVSGGRITVNADDDGVNAAGGNDQSGFGGHGGDIFAADSDAAVLISGGELTVNAGGDGVDSNGSLTVTGGTTLVSGPTNSGNGALDYNGEGTITGGTFIAAGSAGMAMNFSQSSTQGSILVSTGRQQAGTEVVLTAADGTVLASWAPEKEYETVVISCAGIEDGGTYTVEAGTYRTEVTMSGLINGSGSGMGVPGGMGGFGGQTPPDGWTAPDGSTFDGQTPPDGRTAPDGSTFGGGQHGQGTEPAGTAGGENLAV